MKNYSSLLIGGRQFSSRLMVGTGKYKSTQDMVESLSNSETEIITAVSYTHLTLPTKQPV